MDLSGIHVPLATPFENQKIAFDWLSENLQKLNEIDLQGYVLLGSTGEALLLSETEQLELIERAVQNIPDGRLKIAGCMYESEEKALEFLKRVKQMGVQAGLVLPPHYYKSQMTPAVLEKFYLRLADDSGLPILIYHFPAISGIAMSADLIIKIAGHPSVIGIKDSSVDVNLQQTLIHANIPGFQVLTGSAGSLFLSLMAGAAGGIVALGNVAPRQCANLYWFFQFGKFDEARKLQLNLVRLNQFVTSKYGIGGLKYAMERAGYFGGLPRRPLLPPDENARREIDEALRSVGII